MADSSNAAPPTEEIANLHLDEVTGERVSLYLTPPCFLDVGVLVMAEG